VKYIGLSLHSFASGSSSSENRFELPGSSKFAHDKQDLYEGLAVSQFTTMSIDHDHSTFARRFNIPSIQSEFDAVRWNKGWEKVLGTRTPFEHVFPYLGWAGVKGDANHPSLLMM
jgi:hypothetical protein